jgi:hypothetical protein
MPVEHRAVIIEIKKLLIGAWLGRFGGGLDMTATLWMWASAAPAALGGPIALAPNLVWGWLA